MAINTVIYLNGKKLPDFSLEPVEIESVLISKPIGDLHSVPHWRCGWCHSAVVVYEDDEKPGNCPWCGSVLDWGRT